MFKLLFYRYLLTIDPYPHLWRWPLYCTKRFSQKKTTIPTQIKHIRRCRIGLSLALFLFSLGSRSAFCQTSLPLNSQITRNELTFQRYTAKDGLAEIAPHGHTMLQDRNGFLWIPSLTGLNRFDGRQFKVYQYQHGSNEGPSNNKVYHLAEDGEGRLWVGVRSGLMNLFDPATETFTEIGKDLPPSLKPCVESSMVVKGDQEGNIWMAATDGICHCETESMTFRHFSLKGRTADAILEQKNGTIWAGTDRGLFRYFPVRDSFMFYEPYPSRSGELSFNRVESMAEGKNGDIWTSSGKKVQLIFNAHTEQFRPYPKVVQPENGKTYLSLLNTQNGEIWMGRSLHLTRYNPDSQQYRVYEHDGNYSSTHQKGAIVSLLQDRDESLWLSGYGSTGLSVTHSLENKIQVLPSYTYWEALAINDRQMLFGTKKEGFLIFDIHTERFVEGPLPQPLQGSKTNYMRIASNGDLWWRDTAKGRMFMYNFQTGETDQLNQMANFEIDHQNNLWLLGHRLMKYDTQKKTLTDKTNDLKQLAKNDYLDDAVFTVMTIEPSGRMWIGTVRKGLLLFDPNQGTLRVFRYQPNVPHSLPKGSIGKIKIAKGGQRVFLRTDAGISIYLTEQDSFVFVQMDKIVPWALMEGVDGNLWFGGKKGLNKLDVSDYTITNFNHQDGLHYGNVQGLLSAEDAKGYLYFLKRGQLIRFHPDSLQQKDYLSPIVFTDFYLNHQRIKPGQKGSPLQKHIQYQRKLVLKHTQSDFGFRFVSPTFYKADQINYFYKLQDYDADWVPIGNNLEQHFTNIPAGNYLLKLKAQSVAGNWTETGQPIEIKVCPPWWETWWAYLLYFSIFLVVVYYIYQYQMRKQLAEAEADRLKELDVLKTKLYTNITHEFRTPLTVILGMSDQIIQNPDEARQLIRRNSKNLLHLVNQLLDMSKLESQKMELTLVQRNIVSYLRYLTQSFESYAEIKQIDLIFEADLHELVMDFDPDKVQHIIANLLSNAIKFTPENGLVQLSVSEGPQQLKRPYEPFLKIKVADNGMGIEPKNLPHIFDRFFQVDDSVTRQVDGTGIGLALAKELVELMGGTISVESNWSEGTTFTVLLPIKNEAAILPAATLTNVSPLPIEIAKQFLTPTPNQSVADDSLPLLLIIEDNPDVATYIITCLQSQYRIQVAPNGRIGIEMAIETIPDIIISDVMMPEKDGYEVTQTLKEDERTSHIPIILLTAKADMDSKLEGLVSGADAYLAKPFDKKELLVRLEKLIELRQRLQQRYGNIPPNAQRPPSAKFQKEDAFIQKVKETVEAHLDDAEFSVPDLCKKLGTSQSQLYRKIKALTNQSIAAHVRSIRLRKGYHLLQTTDLTVSEVTYEVGFTDPNYFSKSFIKEFGVPPSEVRESS